MTPTSAERLIASGLETARAAGLEPRDLIHAYRIMQTSRKIDDREILLKRQNRIYFQISGAGHEAIQIAAGLLAKAGHDWFYPYYRDRALCLALGITPYEMLLHSFGAASDTQSGGRQMPSHWSDPQKHIVTGSSPTGSQYLHAVGAAQGIQFNDPTSDAISVTLSGEGATSEGEFWEAVNAATLEKLPVLFIIEDNGYAISVPVENQTPGANIARLVANHPGLLVLETDGTDVVASYATLKKATVYCRARKGPALVRASVIRPYSHSLSDDERFYKTPHEREMEAERDPLTKLGRFLLEEAVLDRDELEKLNREVDAEIEDALARADNQTPPSVDGIFKHLYSEKIDPTSAEFEVPSKAASGAEDRTMLDAINLTLNEEMSRNPKMLIFGEDVADCSREASITEVKGKGGVFKVTAGLQGRYGSQRVFNTPIAEAGIVGRSIGMAHLGLKPVGEIQFFDYIWPAMMQIRDELAIIRWRSHGGFGCGIVLRVPIGGYLNGGAIYHSQSGEVIFTHIPGLRVVFPSNAEDACGLLRTAIRCDDPVLFLEHKRLYREPYNRAPHPGPDFTIPFGKARIAKEGQSLTVITYGMLVQKSVVAAAQIERRNPGVSVEVIDLRSLSPYDWPAIEASVKKTNRVIVAHEDAISWGYGAEIAARISEELFHHLDAPVKRIGSLDVWVGYHPVLEDAILPQTNDLAKTMEAVLGH